MKQSARSKLILLFMIMTLCLPGTVTVLANDKQGNTNHLLSDIKSIAAGPTSGYAVNKDGTAFAWGSGVSLGDGKNTYSSIPIKMNIDHVKQIAAGGRHTLILKQDGTVWAIGANNHGQLGNGKKSAAIETTPVQVNGLKDIKAVAAGENHSLALTKNEHVFAWGGNEDGQIGNGSRKDALKPVEVKNIVRVHRLAAGKNISITLGGGGEIFVWGLKQASKGRPNDIRQPTELTTRNGASVEFSSVFAEDTRAVGLDALGRVWLWNNLTSGNLGNTLTLVEGLKNVVSITTDTAVKSDGTVWKWAKNSKGKYVGTQIPGIKNAVSITKGNGTYYVLLKDGRVMSWGVNDKGQAGLGAKDKVIKTPQPVVSLSKAFKPGIEFDFPKGADPDEEAVISLVKASMEAMVNKDKDAFRATLEPAMSDALDSLIDSQRKYKFTKLDRIEPSDKSGRKNIVIRFESLENDTVQEGIYFFISRKGKDGKWKIANID